jgi:hypothetical protein
MKKTFLSLLCVTLLASCFNDNSNENEDPVIVASETSYSKDIYSKRSSREDLVGRLYDEKLKNSKELAELDDAISIAKRYSDSTKGFADYDEKSNDYYTVANMHTGAITDSVLRQKIQSIVKSSLEKYGLLTAQHKQLLSNLDSNNTRISDLEIAMKVLITLSDIQNYQKKNLPSPESMQKAVQKQQDVLQKTTSIVKNHGG